MDIFYYDSKCSFCGRCVEFLTRCGFRGRFIPLLGAKIPKRYSELYSALYFSQNQYYSKSSAVIRALGNCGGFWKLVLVFLVVPPCIRDFVYDWIAKHRYSTI